MEEQEEVDNDYLYYYEPHIPQMNEELPEDIVDDNPNYC